MKFFILIVSVVFFMCGCEDSMRNNVFKIGTNLWPGYESLHLAKSEKLFNENIEVNTYNSATEVLNKFRKKEVDAAALTLDEVILLHDQGYKPVIVAVLDISNGADVLIAHKNIKSIKELNHKSIGVENSALGSYVLTRILEKASLASDAITLVPLSVNHHEEAFKDDIVDAVITFEPVRSKLLEAGGIEIFSSKEIPGEIVDVLVVQNNKKDTKFVNDILKAWDKSVKQINTRDITAMNLISKRLDQSEDSFIASLDGLEIPSLEESNNLIENGKLEHTITKIADIMFDKKLIKSKVKAKDILR